MSMCFWHLPPIPVWKPHDKALINVFIPSVPSPLSRKDIDLLSEYSYQFYLLYLYFSIVYQNCLQFFNGKELPLNPERFAFTDTVEGVMQKLLRIVLMDTFIFRYATTSSTRTTFHNAIFLWDSEYLQSLFIVDRKAALIILKSKHSDVTGRFQ